MFQENYNILNRDLTPNKNIRNQESEKENKKMVDTASSDSFQKSNILPLSDFIAKPLVMRSINPYQMPLFT